MASTNDNPLRRIGEKLLKEAAPLRLIVADLQGDSPQDKKKRLRARVLQEPKMRRVIDAACRHWIENGTWPKMSQIHAMHVADRLGEAVLMCGFLDYHGWRCPGKTEDEILAFFLIDCWEAIGRKAERARLLLTMLPT